MNKKYLFKVLTTGFVLMLAFYSQVFASVMIPCGQKEGDTSSNCWQCGDTCYARLANNKMTVSGTGDMYDFGWKNASGTPSWAPNPPWLSQMSSIHSVEIENGITRVGAYTFSLNANLTELKLGNTVESVGKSAFHSTSISKLEIPASMKTIGEYSFCNNYNRNNLTSLTFEEGSQLERIGQEAFGYGAFTNVTLPNSLKYLDEKAFFRCYNLENIDLPASLKTMGREVLNDTSLTTLIIPDGIESINYVAFPNINANGVFCSLEKLSTVCSGKATGYYEKNSDGTLSLFDRYGNLLSKVKNKWLAKSKFRRVLYTPAEAAQHVNHSNNNKITFTFK